MKACQIRVPGNSPWHYQLVLLAPLPSSRRPAGCSRRSGRQSRSGGILGFDICSKFRVSVTWSAHCRLN